MTSSRQTMIQNFTGIHVRPTTQIVELATGFPCQIKIVHGPEEADAKSVMEVLGLGIEHGETIEIVASGEREDEAVEALVSLVENRFGFDS